MKLIPTELDGPKLFAPNVFGDDRGFFAETFRANLLAEHGITEAFVQDNHSRSARNVVRGLHFQIGKGASKLVRCGRGTIVDVLVDLRPDSPQFGRWEAYELSDENMHLLYAPIGFGHGFVVHSEVADVLYKQSGYYSADVERGISFRDPDIAVDWGIPEDEAIFSQRDLDAPTLAQFRDQLVFEAA